MSTTKAHDMPCQHSREAWKPLGGEVQECVLCGEVLIPRGPAMTWQQWDALQESERQEYREQMD